MKRAWILLLAVLLTVSLTGCVLTVGSPMGDDQNVSAGLSSSTDAKTTDSTTTSTSGETFTSGEMTETSADTRATSVTEQTGTKASHTDASTTTTATAKTIASITSSQTTTTKHTHSWKVTEEAATCTKAGVRKETCAGCGQVKSLAMKALGHTWSDWKTTAAATETAEEKQVRTCSRCGEQQTQTLAKLPDVAAVCKEVWELVNKERQANGLATLTYYADGQAAADLRAQEIQEAFSHTRPSGESCFTVFEELKIGAFMRAENIAMGQRTATEVMEDWMNSSGHHANILDTQATGLVVGYENNHWVQIFVIE